MGTKQEMATETCRCAEFQTAARTNQLARAIHQLTGGRWIVAEWSEQHSQWQGTARASTRRTVTGYCYTCAHSLEALARDCQTYATRAGAVRACELVDGPMCGRCCREVQNLADLREAV